MAIVACAGTRYSKQDLEPWMTAVDELKGDVKPDHLRAAELYDLLAPVYTAEAFEATFGKPFDELEPKESLAIYRSLVEAYPDAWIRLGLAVPFNTSERAVPYREPWLRHIARYEGVSLESVMAARRDEAAARESSIAAAEARRVAAAERARERRAEQNARIEEAVEGLTSWLAEETVNALVDRAQAPNPVAKQIGSSDKTWFECADAATRARVATHIFGAKWAWKDYDELIDQLEVNVWDEGMYRVVLSYRNAYTVSGPSLQDDEWRPIQDAVEAIEVIMRVPLSR
ncbi:MAG: hypothetical protein AAF957_05035 [Planctomycetota bacterium]